MDQFVIECRRRVSLETLRDDLSIYLKILQSAMIELINKDYADFVNLSTNLVPCLYHDSCGSVICTTVIVVIVVVVFLRINMERISDTCHGKLNLQPWIQPASTQK